MNKSKCGSVQMQKKLLMIVVFLFTILTMPILLSSTKVSALKYNVNSIPFYSIYYNSDVDHNPEYSVFEMSVSSDIDIDKLYSQYVFNWKNDSGRCILSSYYKMPYNIKNDSDIFLQYSYFGYDELPDSWHDLSSSSWSLWSSVGACGTVNPLPSYNQGSAVGIVPDNLMGVFNTTLPYRQKSSGIYLSDSYKSEENGLDYSTKFDLGDIFKDAGYPEKINWLNIPYGSPRSEVLDTLSAGDEIKFNGEVIIDWDSPTQNHGFSDNFKITLFSNYISPDSVGSAFIINNPCDYSIKQEYPSDGIESPVDVLNYSCSLYLEDYVSYDYLPYFSVRFDFDYINSNTKFYQFIFDSQVVIINNDDTPGGDWGNAPVGSDTDSAPGSATQFIWNDITSDGVNWTSSLTSLFNFTFVNPFAPIFELFTNSNSCAQIPIIAGMIHSNETQVCPWFDNQTRNIATPVLGIFSMMLVFGFAVRWLGARSGNFVEDNTDGHDWGNIHIGRRK